MLKSFQLDAYTKMTDSKAKARILNPFELDEENLSSVEFMDDISNQENFLQWLLAIAIMKDSKWIWQDFSN